MEFLLSSTKLIVLLYGQGKQAVNVEFVARG